MQVKKFEAPTMAEALNLVKAELGPEAIILSTKNNRKGFGLLSNASVEVTAAVTDKALAKKTITEKVVPNTTKEQIDRLPARKQAEIFDQFGDYYTERVVEKKAQKAAKAAAPKAPSRYIDITDEEEQSQSAATGYGRNGRVPSASAQNPFEALRARPNQSTGPLGGSAHHADTQSVRQSYVNRQEYVAPRQEYNAPTRQAASAPTQNSEQVSALHDEIQRMKGMLEELKTEQTAAVDSRIPEATSEELHVEYQNLIRNGIDKRYATQLAKQVSFALNRDGLKSSDKIVEALAVEMMNNMKVEHPLEFKAGAGERRVFALVGPTGVGKTTTIAKLASQAILQKNLRVGLINIDSYKVAALDQLATYAKILNVPFRSASNATELDRALTEFKPLDLVLIDTSGRSQRDSESLTQMKNLLAENTAVRPLLIMSATTRDQELYDIITRFKIFNPTGLIFSKLDESATFGCIYNIAMKTALPLSYFTVGQRVPEDLEAATRERVVDLVLDI